MIKHVYARYGKVDRQPVDRRQNDYVGIPAEFEEGAISLEELEDLAKDSIPRGYEFLEIKEGDITDNPLQRIC